jgi:hypothetical protein
MGVNVQNLKVGDVLLPKRAKVPVEVTAVYYLKNRDGTRSDVVDYAHAKPMESWKGQTYKASSSYSRTIYKGDGYDYNLEGNVKDQKKENTMTKLFKVLGEETYGIHIGTNTAGELVLEIRGDANNAIKAYKKEALEEVKPYTVKLVPFAGTGNPRHATIEKGKVEKGDVLVWNQTFWSVVELDTKQDECPEITEKNCKRLVVGAL